VGGDADGEVQDRPDGDAEAGAADDVEGVVGADVHPADHHEREADPRDQPPATAEVGGDQAGEGAGEHGVARDEALALQ